MEYGERVRVVNIVPYNRVYNEIFFIIINGYKNIGFIWWRDSASNIYSAIVIWSIFSEYMIYEIEKTCVQLFLSDLVHSFVFIFYQVRAWSKTAWGFYVVYVCPFIFYQMI